MLLAEPAAGATTTQRFGKAVPAVARLEPAMWYSGDRAFWVPFPGSVFWAHFHPGVDKSAPVGTPFLASEAGTVVFAGYNNSISGNAVRVEIQPGVSRYGGNHFLKVLVRVGQKVQKGQPLALVGHSGSTNTGGFVGTTHTYVELFEKGIGWVCWNPDLFVPGGRLQNDPRIQPVGAPTKLVILKGPGINIRFTPDLDVGLDNLFATSRADGIYDRSGKRIHTNVFTGFQLLGSMSNDDGAWVKVTGFHRTLYIHADLVNIH